MALHTTTLKAVGPSGPGALAGFQVTCSCGFTFGSSLRTIAELDAREHVAYIAAKEKGRKGR